MSVFGHPSFRDHEQVAFCHDKKTGLKAIVAIHDTTLGPALGGTRLWNYHSDDEALTDVLRLSRGMTYKAAVAGLNLGGGKAVILGDPKKIKSEELFRAYGRFVDGLGGRYITAEDVNIRVEDMTAIAKETEYYAGGPTGSGDPSPVTALGVFHGIRACVKHKLGLDDLKGLKIAVQGVGSVGTHLCQYLSEEGVQLFISDINQSHVQEIAQRFNATVVAPDKIHSLEVDVFSPCALGAILNDQTIPQLRTTIVAGGANNQMLNESIHARMLVNQGILHAPDYVINAGGLINCYQELIGYNREAALAKTTAIFASLLEVFAIAEKQKITTMAASDHLAEDRLTKAKVKAGQRLRNDLRSQSWYHRQLVVGGQSC